MTGERRESNPLTPESWRPKFYGFVREGRKFRINSLVLKHFAWILAVSIFSGQLYLSFRPAYKKSASLIFAPPQVRADQAAIYVPEPMNAKREMELEKARQSGRVKSRSLPAVERIQPVSLMGLDGIPAGSEVSAELVSAGANGMVKARLLEPVLDQGESLLPKGTVLIGKGTSDEDRLYIHFRKAIVTGRKPLVIQAQAFDEKDRIIGLKGKKVSDYAFKLAASAGLIFLGGVADGMRDDNASSMFMQRRPTMRDAALNGVSTSTADLSHETLESMKNSQSRVVVDHLTRIVVIFGDADANQ